ncbi:hypothetical protein FRACYDRAFT_255217 [Fragilariopsis cylindrus CCMP1102]|uniref:Uncharacterized protein n=1 Tax=Fragilariopsis cylindrus CCMP1102 TaxID=635003 RepID=A0A1E7EK90_9STRA|nr:hypothetical protein FRACYDRAFT_255217 [Fragilariopsis cylindrus CCMP1102]|eukprot:OEU06302.1 hypothetical protein FRACYDRAFT_255217 [Fragilariopsis cylindrus CCMP1102]
MSSFSSSSGGNNNNSMGPPPNQQPRQNPPRGGNGQQHRKSSSLNRSWFEGTMDVISGMAPRPVTPSQNSTHPSSSSSSQTMRPASAPNSPARGMGLGLFGGGGGNNNNNNNNNTHGRGSPHFNHPFPPIDRTNSGGSVGGGSFSIPNFPAGSINRLPSQDSLDRLRRPHSDDGHNLPRHPHHSRGGGLVITASSSMSTEELQQMALDNEELVKEIQELQDQLMEYQGYDKKLIDLQQKLEIAQKNSMNNGNPPRPTTPTHPLLKRQQDRERPPLAPSTSRDADDTDHYRQQLQDAKGELESQSQKLLQHESSVRDSEVERESLEEAHDLRVCELEERFIEVEEEWKRREIDLRTELASASNSQIDVDGIETRIREEQKEHLVELEEQLEQYAEKLAEVAATLAESRQQAKNQEQYRKDEAEDLRMIQDANESEIVRLEKELDEATRELELRDEELEEIKQKYLSLLQRQEKEDEKKVEDESDVVERTESLDVNSGDEEATTTTSSGADDSRRVADLEEQLYNSVDTVNKLELQFEDLQKERDGTIATLESDKAELLLDLKNAVGVQHKDQDPEFSDLKRRLEEKTSKSKEVENRQISDLRKKVEVLELENQEALSTNVVDPIEMKSLQAELDEMQEAAESNRVELRDLRQQLWEAKEAAGSASDLRVELDQARWALDEYKRNNSTEKISSDDNDSDAIDALRAKLDDALSKNEELKVILAEKPLMETKLSDLESELQGRETVIKELRELLSNACAESEQLDYVSRDVDTIRGELKDNVATIEALHKQNDTSKEEMKTIRLELQAQTLNVESLKEQTDSLKKKNTEIEEQLHAKVNDAEMLHNQLESSRDEMDDLNERLQSKTDMVEKLDEQINVSQNDIVDMQGQLEISTSTSRNLTDQSKASQEEVDDIREDVVAKTECIKTLNERVNTMQDEADELRVTLETKAKRIEELEDGVTTLTSDIQRSKQDLQVKTDTIEDIDQRLQTNETQLKEAGNLKMKLGSELADSQARLGALERELSCVITETCVSV